MPPKRGSEDTRGAKAKEQKAKAASEKKERDDAAKAAAEDAEWSAGANARALKKWVAVLVQACLRRASAHSFCAENKRTKQRGQILRRGVPLQQHRWVSLFKGWFVNNTIFP